MKEVNWYTHVTNKYVPRGIQYELTKNKIKSIVQYKKMLKPIKIIHTKHMDFKKKRKYDWIEDEHIIQLLNCRI